MLRLEIKLRRFLGLPWQSSGWDFTFQGRGCWFDPRSGAKIPHVSWPKIQNINNKSNNVTNSIDFKNGPHQKKQKEHLIRIINNNKKDSYSSFLFTSAHQGYKKKKMYSSLQGITFVLFIF